MRYLLLTFLCLLPSVSLAHPDYYIDLAKTQEYIKQRFAEIEVEEYPFPHMIIQDVLPPDVYAQCEKFWPESDKFSHLTSRLSVPVALGAGKEMDLNNSQERFWWVFSEAVMGYVKEEVQKKLIPYLDWKFPDMPDDELAELKKNIRFFNSRQDSLFEDPPGASIGPHVDQAYLFAAMILYAPEDSDHPHQGTHLIDAEGMTAIDTMIADFQGTPTTSVPQPTKVVKQAPYLPNTLSVLLQNPKGWHSVPNPPPNPTRRIYIANIFMNIEDVEKYYPPEIFSYDRTWLYYYWEPTYYFHE